jgi:hypothetical protein
VSLGVVTMAPWLLAVPCVLFLVLLPSPLFTFVCSSLGLLAFCFFLPPLLLPALPSFNRTLRPFAFPFPDSHNTKLYKVRRLGGDNYLGRSATIILAGRVGRERRL